MMTSANILVRWMKFLMLTIVCQRDSSAASVAETFPTCVAQKPCRLMTLQLLVLALFLSGKTFGQSGRTSDRDVQFASDVLPILSANCFSCHGPDETHRQADLRLDLEPDAKRSLQGTAAIVEESPETSEIIKRLLSTDPDVVMPPPTSNRQLEPSQIETIRQWIAQGAKWQRHWAFEPIQKPAGNLDELVRQRLSAHGFTPPQSAPPHTLARRLALDLIGLPPDRQMVETLTAAAAQSPENYQAAYEQLVDELLKRPEFGEHWARMWLDLARYADTKGYEKDRGRTMWPYRDWVINAFNSDMPLDQFTAAQLAGDLLENPTQDQIVATAFHRNTMSNDEGGTDDEEFRVAAVKDRINTTVQVWMGLTMGCAQCHTHKYDPISIDEYYRFYAIFNQTEDADRPDDSPKLEIVTEDQRTERTRLAAVIAELKKDVALALEQGAWGADAGQPIWVPPTFGQATSIGGATLTQDNADHSISVSGQSPPQDTYEMTMTLAAGRHTALRLEALPSKASEGPAALSVGRSSKDPNFVVSELMFRLDGDAAPLPLTMPRASYSQGGWPVAAAIDGDLKTGWAISPRKQERHVAVFNFAQPLVLESPRKVQITIVQNYGEGLTLARFRLSTTSVTDPTNVSLETDSPDSIRLKAELAAVEKQLTDLNARIVQLPILRELPDARRRPSKIHLRGNFLDQGTEVQPAVLSSLHPLASPETPTRLSVAQWLVSDDNPLTPRVWVNRVWGRMFGRGLVETEEDFGTLGSSPTHPEVLDWLAANYRDGDWSHKQLLKTIVMSETYRQSSAVDVKVLAQDPDNRYLSWAPRYRLTGEVLRDQALAVSGLLSSKMGGPPVMPPQPEGLWRSTYSGEQWIDAEGEDRFRRAIYTFLKRTTPYPSLITFDGGSGEVCLIRRIRTNTPLQALVTLNDPVFMESAAALAGKLLVQSSASDEARVDLGLRLALHRPPRAGESAPLVRLRQQALSGFKSDPKRVEELLVTTRAQVGEHDPAEFASWIVVGSVILNLDEFLTRN